MKRILFLAGLVLFLLAGCGGGGSDRKRTSAAPADLAPTLTEIKIEPDTLTLAPDTAQRLAAVGTFSDGTTKDVTAEAQWESSSPSAVMVGNGEEAGLVRAIERGGQAVVTATIGDKSAQAQIQVSTATLDAIRIDQTDGLSLPVGVSGQLTATGVLSDGTTQDVTRSLDWSSANETVAQVGNDLETGGKVTPVSRGTVTITAKHPFLDLTPATTQVEVTDAVLRSLTISPAQADVPLGALYTLTATGRYSDGSEFDLTEAVAWSLSNTSIAALEGAGKVRAKSRGEVVVTATLGDVPPVQATLTVTEKALTDLKITPADAAILPGMSKTFDVFAIYSDGSVFEVTDDAEWTSSDTDVATVGSFPSFITKPGSVTAKKPGTAEIAAEYKGFTAKARVTVTTGTPKKLVISTPEFPFLPMREYPFTAMCVYSDGTLADVTDQAEWISRDPVVASVENAVGKWGLVMTRIKGATEIVADFKGLEDSIAITVE